MRAENNKKGEGSLSFLFIGKKNHVLWYSLVLFLGTDLGTKYKFVVILDVKKQYFIVTSYKVLVVKMCNINKKPWKTTVFCCLVETVGIEPTTPCMSSMYSNHLSYASMSRRLP